MGNRRDVGDSFMGGAASTVQAIMSIAERFYQVLIIMTINYQGKEIIL